MKTNNAYRALLDDLCLRTNMASTIKDLEQFYRTADIVVDDIGFSLMPGAGDNEGYLLFFCDFGELPQEGSALAMRRLLEANLALMGVGRPNFGINFATGRVLLSGALPIADANGELLTQMLHHYASQAKEWRTTFFLLEEEHKMIDAPRLAQLRAAEMMRRSQQTSITATSRSTK